MGRGRLWLILGVICLVGCNESMEYEYTYQCEGASCWGVPACVDGAYACDADNTPKICRNGAYVRLTTCSEGTTCEVGTGKCNPSAQVVCTEGQKQCNGSVPQICHDNAWVAQDACGDGYSCVNGDCQQNEVPVTCADGEKSCADGMTPRVCQDNAWVVQDACGEGYHCDSGNCIEGAMPETCINDDKSCFDEMTPEVCQEGTWVKRDACGEGYHCKDGDCIENDAPQCENEEKSCIDGMTPAVCQDGAWVNQDACEEGFHCDAGDCIEGDVPEPCIDEEKSCINDIMPAVCQDGTWVNQDACEEGYHCDSGDCIENDQPECENEEKSCIDEMTPAVCEEGAWVNQDACEEGYHCDSGDCVEDERPECEDDEIACKDDTTPKSCKDGKWTVLEACDEGFACKDGECIYVEPPCENGVKECSDSQTSRECKNGKWVSSDCGRYSVCQEGACVVAVQQGDPCEDDFTTFCVDDKYYQCLPRLHEVIVTDCKAEDGLTCTTNPKNQFCAHENGISLFTQADYEEMDIFLEDTFLKAKIPGMAIGIIRNNEVVYKRGFGRTRLAEDSPAITSQTLFPIMSTSKNMTSYMAAKLVAEGYMNWDDTIKSYLDEFQSTDENFTNTATIKQGLSHSTGIKGRDDLWYSYLNLSAEEMVSKFHDPVGEPGKYYDYSNQMYATAGYAVTRSKYRDGTLFEAYQKAMQEYVFDPLGMTSTTIDRDKATAEGSDYAHAIEKTIHGIREIPIDELTPFLDPIAPAGAVFSNIDDMMVYILEQITNTEPEQLARREHIILDAEETDAKEGYFVWYGLGTIMHELNYGHTILDFGHDGGMTGGRSHMIYYPEEKIGIAVLHNSSYTAASYVSMLAEYKTVFQALHQSSDYSRYVTLTDDEWQMLEDYDQEQLEDYALNPPQSRINAIVGRYSSEELGEAIIRYENGFLIYEAKDLWEAEINFLKSEPDYFCFTSNPSSAAGICAYYVLNENGRKVLGFVFPYDDIDFYHTFTRIE